MTSYTPRENDAVVLKGSGLTRYAVVKVDDSSKTVDLQNFTADGGVMKYKGRVPWSEISPLDES